MILSLAGLLPPLAGVASAGSGIAEIRISFRLDPRLTRGLYMGDRWVSPSTYTSTVQEGNEIQVDARAEGRTANGTAATIQPEWTPEDPGMVTVRPRQGREVTIAVRRAGQSKLTVTSGTVSKELSIRATATGKAIQVEISQ